MVPWGTILHPWHHESLGGVQLDHRTMEGVAKFQPCLIARVATSPSSISKQSIQCGAPKIAKLVYN